MPNISTDMTVSRYGHYQYHYPNLIIIINISSSKHMKSSHYVSRRRNAVLLTAQARNDPADSRNYRRVDGKLMRRFKSEQNLRDQVRSWNSKPSKFVAEKDCDRSRVLEVILNPSSEDLLHSLERGLQQNKRVAEMHDSELFHQRQVIKNGKHAREEYNTKLKNRLREKIKQAEEKLAQMNHCYQERKEEKRMILEDKLRQFKSERGVGLRKMASF